MQTQYNREENGECMRVEEQPPDVTRTYAGRKAALELRISLQVGRDLRSSESSTELRWISLGVGKHLRAADFPQDQLFRYSISRALII